MSDPKPQVIRELEQEFGFELEEAELEDIWDEDKLFSKNENGDITGLNFDKEKISNISSLANLKELKILSLNSTQVNDVSTLKGLVNLTELDLSNTQVSDVSDLKELTNLQILHLSSTQVNDVSDLKGLTNLQILVLGNTQVSDVSDLKELTNLTHLFLYETQVSDVSDLKELKNLFQLYLSDTQVSDISALKELNKLQTLDIRNCKIETIPIEIAEKFEFTKWEDTWESDKISLYGNPIEDFLPPEIINKGQKAVITYLQSKGIERDWIRRDWLKEELERSTNSKPVEEERIRGIRDTRPPSVLTRLTLSYHGVAPLNEAKTLIIGAGGSGKTSLMRQLMNQKFNPKEDQTHGIRILKHRIDYKDEENTKIDVHFWDFGGQEINHATHQFFYSKRSLYVLVLDARQEQQAEYWLKYIESFGGNSPVLVVLNKIDENPAFEVNRRFLLEKYPNIKQSENFYRVSCSTGEGIAALREAVHGALYDLDLRKMELAPSWFAVKEALTNMKENYISYDKYFEICRECNVTDATAQEVLRDLIHDLGLALDFRRLRDFNRQVLNPKWITNGVYRIINSPKVGGEGKGVLRFGGLDDILHDWERYNAEDDKNYEYPAHTHRYITGIMQEFQLCYKLDESAYIVPDLLPVQEPAGLDYVAHPLHFVIRYEDLLPRSVMPRFMVQMHHRIPEGTDKRWRTGVVIREPLYEASAIIRADYAEKEIHIWVKGKDRQRMLSFIRKTFEGIRASFSKLNVSEWYVIQKEKGKKAVVVDYETLVICDKENNGLYFCPELRKNFNTKDVLNGIEAPESRADLPKIRAFISYSHKDEKLKEEFKAHLMPLTYEYGLDLWDDREIDAGATWEDEIIAHLERDVLIFLLISADAIASEYIWQKEIPKAIQRHNSGEVIVIPVILRPCAWEGLDFGKIQAVPKNTEPITTWENQDSAWLDAVQQIETVLKGERLEGLRGGRF